MPDRSRVRSQLRMWWLTMLRPANALATGRLAAVSAVLATLACVPVASGASVPTLLVNDSDTASSVGDSLLSLDEAIRLANGSLALPSLSAAERQQVRGRP